MSTHPILQTSYSNPEIELYLDTTHTKLSDYSTIQGKQDAQKEDEINELSFKVKILDHIQSEIQLGIDYIRQALLPASKVIAVKEFEVHAIKECKKNQVEIDYNEHLLGPLNRKKKTLTPDPLKLKYRKWLLFIAILVGCADGALAYKSFRTGLYSNILALVAAVAIGGVIALSHVGYAGWINKATTEVKKYVRMGIILSVAFIFFAWISHLRAESINSTINVSVDNTPGMINTTPHISSWAICVVSFVLFVAVFFLSLLFWRSKEERLKEYEYESLCKESDKIMDDIKKLKEEIRGLQSSVQLEKKLARDCYDFTKKSIVRIKNMGEASISLYKSTYARFHLTVPAFFQKRVEFVYDDALHFFETTKEEVA